MFYSLMIGKGFLNDTERDPSKSTVGSYLFCIGQLCLLLYANYKFGSFRGCSDCSDWVLFFYIAAAGSSFTFHMIQEWCLGVETCKYLDVNFLAFNFFGGGGAQRLTPGTQ